MYLYILYIIVYFSREITVFYLSLRDLCVVYHHEVDRVTNIFFMLQEMCQRPKFMVDSSRLVSQGNGVVSTGVGGSGNSGISGEPVRNGTVGGSGGRCGVEPGELGDHSFLAAVSSLTLTPKFLDRVVPFDQSFDTTTSYCGLFR